VIHPENIGAENLYKFGRSFQRLQHLTVNIFGKKHAIDNREWRWKLRSVLYTVSKFHELCSTNGEKWDCHIYLATVNAVCCFIAALQREIIEQNSTKLCNMLGSEPDLQTHVKSCRDSLLQKLGS